MRSKTTPPCKYTQEVLYFPYESRNREHLVCQPLFQVVCDVHITSV